MDILDRKDLFRAYFTESSKYYYDKLEKFEKGTKYTFNFEAGFFGVMWLLYRRMYKEGIVLFIISFLLSAVFGYFLAVINPFDEMNQIYSQIILWILQFIILGFLGNTLYILKSRIIVDKFTSIPNRDNNEVIDNVDLTYEVSEEDIKEIRKVGGTRMDIVLLYLGISIILNMALKFA